LIDRPLAYAPYDRNDVIDANGSIANRHAPLVNRLPGLRGFHTPDMVKGGPTSPGAVSGGDAGSSYKDGRAQRSTQHSKAQRGTAKHSEPQRSTAKHSEAQSSAWALTHASG